MKTETDAITVAVVAACLRAKKEFYIQQIEAKAENWQGAQALLVNLERILSRIEALQQEGGA